MTDDLEQLVRDSLARRADDVDTTVPLVARARQTVRRRRGTRAVVAAAAAVVVVLVGVAATVDVDPHPDIEPVPGPAPTAVTDPVDALAPDGWRTERWHDLAVDVPADWDYGEAPVAFDGAGRSTVCGQVPKTPYVGRPIHASDLCRTAVRRPDAAYVWLGADVPPGTIMVGDLTQETVEVAGTTLTVAGDEVLRRRILASARTGGTCPSELRRAPTRPLPLPDSADGLQACVYRNEDGRLRLAGSELQPASAAVAFEDDYGEAAYSSHAPRCPAQLELGILVLQAGERQWVLDPGCSGVRELAPGPSSYRDLSVATMEPWAAALLDHHLDRPWGGF